MNTISNKETFIEKIDYCKNIYDIMACAYCELSQNKQYSCNYDEYPELNNIFALYIEENSNNKLVNINYTIDAIKTYFKACQKVVNDNFFYNMIQQIDKINYQYPKTGVFFFKICSYKCT